MTAPTAGTGPTHPGPTHPSPSGPPAPSPPTPSIADDLTAVEILLDNAIALAAAFRPPADLSTRRAADAACAAVVLDFRLRAARLAVRELAAAAQSPARQPFERAGEGASLGIATTGGPASPGRGEHVDASPRPDFPGGEGGGRPFPRLSFDLGVGPQYDALPRGESWLGR